MQGLGDWPLRSAVAMMAIAISWPFGVSGCFSIEIMPAISASLISQLFLELGIDHIAHIFCIIQDHGQPLDSQPEVHDGVRNIILRERRSGVDAKGRDLDPAILIFRIAAFEGRVIPVYFDLRIGRVIFTALVIRLEPELGETELFSAVRQRRLCRARR